MHGRNQQQGQAAATTGSLFDPPVEMRKAETECFAEIRKKSQSSRLPGLDTSIPREGKGIRDEISTISRQGRSFGQPHASGVHTPRWIAHTAPVGEGRQAARQKTKAAAAPQLRVFFRTEPKRGVYVDKKRRRSPNRMQRKERGGRRVGVRLLVGHSRPLLPFFPTAPAVSRLSLCLCRAMYSTREITTLASEAFRFVSASEVDQRAI